MKNIIIGALFLVSSSAMACPDLHGNFLCKAFTNGKDQHISMVQGMDQGVTTLQMTILVDGEPTSVRNFRADGVTRSLDRDGYSAYVNKAFCDADMLKVEVKGTGSDANHPDQDGLIIFKLDAAGNMYDSYLGKWGSVPNKFFEETCQRVN